MADHARDDRERRCEFSDPVGPVRVPAEGAGDPGPDAVPEPIPEADDEVTADAWEQSESMKGEAPTG